MSGFAQRAIDVTFNLVAAMDEHGNPGAKASFAGTSGADQVTISGRRVSATIIKNGDAAQGETQIRIYGMPLSQMNQLSTLGKLPGQVGRNTVTINAGDLGTPLAQVFQGTITAAWTDFQDGEAAAFQVQAFSMGLLAVQPAPPTSYSGGTDVATIMGALAKQAGLQFENNGVSVKLAAPYLAGTVWDQIKACGQAANIKWTVDNGTLAIWPKDGARSGTIPLLSASTGMVGYPSFNPIGLVVTCLFNPAIVHGGGVKVQSIVTPANGTWYVSTLTHLLESEMPDGQWFTTLGCTPFGYLTS